MILFEGLSENLQFIILETVKQLEGTLEYIRRPVEANYRDIIERDNYVDNLKTTIEDLCFSRILSAKGKGRPSKSDTDVVRAFHIIAVNLERIADNCVNIIQQTDYLEAISFIHEFKYEKMLRVLIAGVRKIPQVLESRSLNDALEICKVEDETDVYYKDNLDNILVMLESGGHTRNLVTVLFIYRYLERMGTPCSTSEKPSSSGLSGRKFALHKSSRLPAISRATAWRITWPRCRSAPISELVPDAGSVR